MGYAIIIGLLVTLLSLATVTLRYVSLVVDDLGRLIGEIAQLRVDLALSKVDEARLAVAAHDLNEHSARAKAALDAHAVPTAAKE